jgi:hypothetical protein
MVSSISSGSGGVDTASIQQIRSQAARMLKAADTNKDSKITENELSKAIGASGSKSGPTPAEIMKQLDQGSKGYLTQQDLEAGLAKADQAKPAHAPRQSGSGGGAAPAAGGAGSPSTARTSGTTEQDTYDPADLNQDGTITVLETVQYAQQVYARQQEPPTHNQLSLYA